MISVKRALWAWLFWAPVAWGQSVYEENGYWHLFVHGQMVRVKIPQKLQKSSDYRVRFSQKALAQLMPKVPAYPVASGGNGGGGTVNPARGSGSSPGPTPEVPPQKQVKKPVKKTPLSSLLYRANQLFKKRQWERAMDLLDTAESMAPENPKVLAMKGSLFFLMGWKGYARQYWEKSLEQDAAQPKIKRYLDQLPTTSEQNGGEL